MRHDNQKEVSLQIQDRVYCRSVSPSLRWLPTVLRDIFHYQTQFDVTLLILCNLIVHIMIYQHRSMPVASKTTFSPFLIQDASFNE